VGHWHCGKGLEVHLSGVLILQTAGGTAGSSDIFLESSFQCGTVAANPHKLGT